MERQASERQQLLPAPPVRRERRGVPKGSFNRSFWPSPLQHRLLLVALESPDRSAAEWQELQREFSLDESEPGSFELMPLVYRALLAGGGNDPLMGRLKGIYRKSWVLGTLLLERTKSASEAFEKAEIGAVFVAGPILGARYYEDAASRYSPQIEVLVEENDLAHAVSLLARDDWFERPGSGDGTSEQRRLFDAEGSSLLLRTRVTCDFGDGGAGFDVPRQSVEYQDIGGVAVPVLTPTETLLVVCASGAREGPTPDVQWLADAAMIIRTHELDWDRLVERAAATHQTTRLKAALEYLDRLPGPHTPPVVGEMLAAQPVSRRDRISFRLASGGPRVLGALPTSLAEHLAATRERSAIHAIASFPAFLLDRWDLHHLWQLPGAIGRRTARRLTRGHADERIPR